MAQPMLTSMTATLTTVALCATLALSAGTAHAQGRGASNASEAAALVKSRSGARVLGVRAQGQGGSKSYRVKIITPKGVVRVVTVPHRRR